VVVFKNFGGWYYRDQIIMEQDGENAQYSWKDSNVETFMDASDQFAPNLGGADKNHPKVYVTSTHHSMWPNRCGDNLKGLCDRTFRPNDWYMFDFSDASNLVKIDAGTGNGGIDASWDFSPASNPWWTVWGMCDMCTVQGEYRTWCDVSIPMHCGRDPQHDVCTCDHSTRPTPLPAAAPAINDTGLFKQVM
jgi:hypothetical protein